MQLDHVIIAVADLDAATARYAAILGRPAAVRSAHPAHGTENALFLFERGPYLELIALRAGASDDFAAPLRTFLSAHGEGISGLALTPDDLDTALARLRAAGFALDDARQGTGVCADGRVRAWRNTRLPPATLYDSFSLLIEHEGWDWRTDLRLPPDRERGGGAASSIHHIAVDVADARATSADWTAWFGLHCAETIESERMGARVLIHPAGTATIEAVSATTAHGPVAERIATRGAGLAGLAFEVADLDAGVAALRAAGIGVSDPAPGVLPASRVARITPSDACGVAAQLLQFE